MRKLLVPTSTFLATMLVAACGSSSAPDFEHATAADADRFLEQSSFGPTDASLAEVESKGIKSYLDQQLATAPTGYSGYTYMDPNSTVGCPSGSSATCYRDNYTLFPLQTSFFRNAVNGSDQLRQRVAFALSQIMVTSGAVLNQPYAMAAYQNILLNDAFGNYRQLLEDVTLSPAMGAYLNMVNNDKANAATGTSPNENYGREINQLFSIGTVMLNADGTPQLDGNGATIPTYDQSTVEGFASLFTGWTYPAMPGATAKWTDPTYYLGPMVPIAAHHDMNAKQLLNNVTLPAGQDANTDLKQGLDNIFNHPNVGPFFGKQLIQFLVTGNPSPAYVSRITAVFNNNGNGVRGDLAAVVSAILLDPEARGDLKSDPGYGRLFEPAQLLAGIVRGVGGGSYADGVFFQSAATAEQQNIYQPGSVFSFFPPTYVIPDTGILNPVFGIYGASTAFARTNTLATMISGDVGADSSVSGSTGTHLDMTAWENLANDPAALTTKINTMFFHGAMSATMQAAIVQSVNGIDATDAITRARAALYLALTSVQYQVEQ